MKRMKAVQSFGASRGHTLSLLVSLSNPLVRKSAAKFQKGNLHGL